MSYNKRGMDPQIKLLATVKPSTRNEDVEIMTFSYRLALFEAVFIVNLPEEGQDKVPVYVKHKVNEPQQHDESHERASESDAS
jgi:hypothetical protein